MSVYGFTQDMKRNRIADQRLTNTFSGANLEIAKKIQSNESVQGSYAILIFQFGIMGGIIFGLFPMLFIPIIIKTFWLQGIIAIVLGIIGFILGYWLGNKTYGPKYDRAFKENQDFKISHSEIYKSVVTKE